jgi:cytochrome c oxidase subunit 2
MFAFTMAVFVAALLVACGQTPKAPAGGATEADRLAGDVARGEEIVKARGCLACHSNDGSKLVGPTFKGLYGSEVALDDGSSQVVDDAYIRESILQPAVKTAQGFPAGTMPAYNLDDAQIEDVLAYLESLKQ